jgi:hypothetical protein
VIQEALLALVQEQVGSDAVIFKGKPDPPLATTSLLELDKEKEQVGF